MGFWNNLLQLRGKQKGFSLVESMLAVAVLSFTSFAVVGSLSNIVKSSKKLINVSTNDSEFFKNVVAADVKKQLTALLFYTVNVKNKCSTAGNLMFPGSDEFAINGKGFYAVSSSSVMGKWRAGASVRDDSAKLLSDINTCRTGGLNTSTRRSIAGQSHFTYCMLYDASGVLAPSSVADSLNTKANNNFSLVYVDVDFFDPVSSAPILCQDRPDKIADSTIIGIHVNRAIKADLRMYSVVSALNTLNKTNKDYLITMSSQNMLIKKPGRQVVNCNNYSIDPAYLAQCGPYVAPTPDLTCASPFEGVVARIPDGGVVNACAAETVPFGSDCACENRTCSASILSGSYSFQTCEVGKKTTCDLPWGGTIAVGSDIKACKALTVPFGSTCSCAMRMCSTTGLGGDASFTANTCTVDPEPTKPPVTCTLDGETKDVGGTITRWLAASVTAPAICTSQTRTCLSSGSFDGSYSATTCTVIPAAVIPVVPPTTCTNPCPSGGTYDAGTSSCKSTGATITTNVTSNEVSARICNDHHAYLTFEPMGGTSLRVKTLNYDPTATVAGWNCYGWEALWRGNALMDMIPPTNDGSDGSDVIGNIDLVSTDGKSITSISSIDKLTFNYSSRYYLLDAFGTKVYYDASCDNKSGTITYDSSISADTKNEAYYVSLCPGGGAQFPTITISANGSATVTGNVSSPSACTPTPPVVPVVTPGCEATLFDFSAWDSSCAIWQ